MKTGSKLSILLVDDEQDIRETLSAFLEMMGVFESIIEAFDGGDAIRKCKNQTFDMIITDLNMPNVKGIDFITHVRRDEKRLALKEKSAVIILSANVTGEEITKAVSFGITDIITKPCTAEEFISKVSEVLVKKKRNKIRIVKS